MKNIVFLFVLMGLMTGCSTVYHDCNCNLSDSRTGELRMNSWYVAADATYNNIIQMKRQGMVVPTTLKEYVDTLIYEGKDLCEMYPSRWTARHEGLIYALYSTKNETVIIVER